MSDHHVNYKSEITGYLMFAIANWLALNSERRQRLSLLADLERQTRDRYLDYIARNQLKASYPVGAALLGVVMGIVSWFLPSQTLWKLLLSGTGPLIQDFKALLSDCEQSAVSEADFFRYVVDHEESIEEFARRALAGRTDALDPVRELLV